MPAPPPTAAVASPPPRAAPQQSSELMGIIAYSAVIVASFVQLPLARELHASMPQIIALFVAGAVYFLLAASSSRWTDRGDARTTAGYFAVQLALLTFLIFASPAHGFFGMIALPLAAQAVFDLGWRGATVVGIITYSLCIGVLGFHYGSAAAGRAAIQFAPAFFFTTIFSLMTRRALAAQRRSDELARALEHANQLLRDQADRAASLATAEERNRVAREIHDGLGHYLTVIHVQLEAAQAVLDREPAQARQSVATAARLTQEALADVRRSVGQLRTDLPTEPLPHAAARLVTESGLPAQLQIAGTPRDLAPGLAHALFRALQEGLTNIRKHAPAAHAEVLLDFSAPARVRVVITDDGRGAAPAPASPVTTPTSGFGLRGLRERLEVLGGHVTAVPRAGTAGFALTIDVPA